MGIPADLRVLGRSGMSPESQATSLRMVGLTVSTLSSIRAPDSSTE